MITGASFRPDIEGLRALSILMVVAFHHNWASCFTGGFVGVDIFFVISGYLITRNIFTQVNNNEFSLKEFSLRRAGRLLPALFLTIALTLAVGICLSSPADLQRIAESAVSSIFSVSNFYFWSQSGYFDAASIQKPLLHTWALAVEVQFYLIWPFIIILLVKCFKMHPHRIAALAILGVLSVGAAEIAIGRDISGAFYLMPYRIGEFTLGALCAWLPKRSVFSERMRNVLVLLGLGLIFWAIFSYTDTTRFPGLTALVPCMGAVLLIRFGENNRIVGPLLTNRIAVGIGRISYSLYLVHWPAYVFFRQWHGSDLNSGRGIVISIFSIILALGVFRYVEQPFRIHSGSAQVKFISKRSFVKLLAVLVLCLITTSVTIWVGDGWAWRFPNDLSRFAREAEKEKTARFDLYRERCLGNNNVSCDRPVEGVNVFIIGDSHAPDAFNALASQYPQYHYVVNGLAGCPPLVREDYHLLTVKHPVRIHGVPPGSWPLPIDMTRQVFFQKNPQIYNPLI